MLGCRPCRDMDNSAPLRAPTKSWGLRHAWNALICAFEGVDRSPMEEIVDRIERLERKMAARD